MTDDATRGRLGERLMARRARERDEDRAAGRPERGLFTGRGRRKFASAPVVDEDLDDELDDEVDDEDDDFEDERAAPSRPRPRTGAKRSVLTAIRQIPAYIRMLFGLMSDRRVSKIDRFFVIAAAAYMISPLDFIPDLIPFFGQVDDVFLVVMALQRLVDNTGRRVLLDHWQGDPDELSDVNLTQLVSAAGFFLPPAIRKGIRSMVRRGKS